MKDDYAPLVLALAMAIFTSIFWYANSSDRSETIRLAGEVEAFLEAHRTESAEHLVAQQKARELHNLTQSPNRAFLIMLCVVIAVQASTAFFKNTKGHHIAQRAKQIWTWRP